VILPNIFRSFFFRVTVASTIVLAICLLGLGTIWWYTIRQTFQAQFQQAVQSETALLVDVNRHYGHDALVTAISNQRLSPRKLVYGLFSPDGQRIVGQLTFPVKVKGDWAYYRFEDPSDGEPYPWRALVTHLPDHNILLVGSSFEVQHELLEKLISHLITFMIAILVLMVGGGIFLSRLFSHRLSLFNQAIRQIAQGDLSQRVPVRGNGDEFDVLSAQVNIMLGNIQNLTENLRQVSTDIAHDIRTPLSHLYKHLEAALHTPETGRHHIEKALANAQSMLDIFTAMLRLAEIEAGSLRSGFKPLDLSTLVSDTCDAYLPSYQEQGHHLSTDIATGITLTGDEPLLRQMLSNLLENGLIHTPRGSQHKVALTTGNGKAILTIEDNGPGIPAEEHHNVLKRFYRLSKSRNVPGSGLGLATVHAVAKLHDAKLEVFDTEPGLGVRITF
jgi:signal transduction histidine kinase